MATSENTTSGLPPDPPGFSFDWKKYGHLYEEITVPARTPPIRSTSPPAIPPPPRIS